MSSLPFNVCVEIEAQLLIYKDHFRHVDIGFIHTAPASPFEGELDALGC
jgi:hypothetical protein